MLRYAIEKLPEQKRKKYLNKGNASKKRGRKTKKDPAIGDVTTTDSNADTKTDSKPDADSEDAPETDTEADAAGVGEGEPRRATRAQAKRRHL